MSKRCGARPTSRSAAPRETGAAGASYHPLPVRARRPARAGSSWTAASPCWPWSDRARTVAPRRNCGPGTCCSSKATGRRWLEMAGHPGPARRRFPRAGAPADRPPGHGLEPGDRRPRADGRPARHGQSPPVVAAMLAAGAMILLRVVTVQQAYRGISWTTVLLVAGMIPMSTAITIGRRHRRSPKCSSTPSAMPADRAARRPVRRHRRLRPADQQHRDRADDDSRGRLGGRPAGRIGPPGPDEPVRRGGASFLTPVATPANMMVMGPAVTGSGTTGGGSADGSRLLRCLRRTCPTHLAVLTAQGGKKWSTGYFSPSRSHDINRIAMFRKELVCASFWRVYFEPYRPCIRARRNLASSPGGRCLHGCTIQRRGPLRKLSWKDCWENHLKDPERKMGRPGCTFLPRGGCGGFRRLGKSSPRSTDCICQISCVAFRVKYYVVPLHITWTLGCEAGLGAQLTGILYYDGQGFMVMRKSGIGKIDNLNGATICVDTETTSKDNLDDYFQARGWKYQPSSLNR